MHITYLKIENFRALTNVEMSPQKTCNVIVGPNGIGKTTVLEAIRLTKALLAPRTQNESNQVLSFLGVNTPGIPNRLFISAIAGNDKMPVHIKCVMQLDGNEFAVLKEETSINDMATQIMLSTMGRPFANPVDLIGLLSNPMGQKQHQGFIQMLRVSIAEIESNKKECNLEVTINPTTGQITAGDPLSGVLISYLDRRLPPNNTIFNYFTADRAIPHQDQPVQIGVQDATTQMESYNSQPQQKYQRLKSTIFGSVIAGKKDQQDLQFEQIFNRILKGKQLCNIGVNNHGALKIVIKDVESKSEFSIDAMSSGEKGLLLTCLIIAQTMERGGIVLLDEPELHLNPSVCRDVLTFLVEQYAKPNDLQLFICSHSPEILDVAFEREDCGLFHLISGNVIAPVRRQDVEEVEGALRRLGGSPSEGLLYKGTVFVEGERDSDVLEEGFQTLFRRYKVRDLRGRTNIEKEIESLQESESKADSMAKTFFILDHDGKQTTLKSSKYVKVLQWNRRCLENYLLDINSLTDLVKNSQYAKKPITNIASVHSLLKNLAFSQIDELSVRQIFQEEGFMSLTYTNREIQGKTFEEFADLVLTKIQSMKSQLSPLDEAKWKTDFIGKCEERKKQIEERWQSLWESECDGKKLMRDFYQEVGVFETLTKFKIRIISMMSVAKSDNWRAMDGLLRDLLADTKTS